MNKNSLENLYFVEKKSALEISNLLNCSVSKVNYWMNKHQITKRSISEGVYIKSNPKGDPFKFEKPKNIEQSFLYGLGLGLFWGEGNKKNEHSVRLGNTDSRLVKSFIRFLLEIFKVEKSKLRFGLQVFNDIDPEKALSFWINELGFSKDHFLPTIVVSEIRGKGTYKKKSEYGVLTVYFNNKKLKNKLMSLIENIG